MVDKNTSSLLWMGTTGWPCLLGYFALFSTASRRSVRSWRSVLLRMRRRSGTYGKVVVLHWDQFFGVGGKPAKQNTRSLGGFNFFLKFSAPGPGEKQFPNLDESGTTRSMLTPLQSWWSLDEKPKSTAISSWSPRRFSKGMMVWESIMAIQSKWQEIHFWLLFGMKLLFALQDATFWFCSLDLPCWWALQLQLLWEAKLLFVVRIAGIIKMSPKPRPETKQCIYVM